jgi:hypothetical protein
MSPGRAVRRGAAAALLAALAVVPAGCGQTESASSSDAGRPDASLALGEQAVAPFVDYGTDRESQPTEVAVRVLDVDRGRIADLEPFDLSPAEKRSVPYYVHATFENRGDFAVSRSLLRVSMDDADGREHRPATLVLLGGRFEPCPETPSAPLRPGERFASCSPILLPKGTEPGRVRFQGDVAQDPLHWEIGP